MIEAIVRAALGSWFTGAVVRVERAGRLAFEGAYGAVDDTAGARAVTATTRFDVASLTKIAVATAVLAAVADGVLALDGSLGHVLPEWRGTPHAAVSLRMLLAHTGGLQSGADYRTLRGERVEAWALARPLVAAPGAGVIYSDLGFIALGVALARARGTSLAVAVETAARATGTKALAYRPQGRDRDTIPATELDAWRGRVRGDVHDEKAYLMGGIAGHAGLFADAADVARLGEVFLGPLHRRPPGIVPLDLIAEATREQGADAVLRRGLGWALKTRDDNSCGPAMSRATFGHTGFTGTSLWIDPQRDLSVTILTNAVYYARRDLREVRIALAEAAVAAYGS